MIILGIGVALGLILASIWETWREFQQPDDLESVREWSAGVEAFDRLRR